jgi:AcrR family transcriptional regulator
MPKIIDYADRYEAVREVVYEIALEQGAEAISTAAVAERLHMSTRTLQRLVASAEALPVLGLQRAERLARNRFLRRSTFPAWLRLPEAERALAMLLDELPGSPEREDRQVYWALLLGHGDRCDWARSARVEQAEGLATLCAASLTGLREDRRAAEVMRLRFLVTGAITEVFRDPASHAEAERIIRRHVTEVLGVQGTRDDAA